MKFSPERRIRKRHEFQAIQSQGRRLVSDNFVFIIALGPTPSGASRLGITVTRKVGNSVRRSRIKRIVRAAFQRENGFIPAGFDLVVICRKDGPTLSTNDVVSQFLGSTKKLKKALESLNPAPKAEDEIAASTLKGDQCDTYLASSPSS